MKVFINRQKVNTRARLSNLASIGGLVLLLASVVVPLVIPSWSGLAYILLIVGMGVAMVGIYFANRWVRKPRPEDSLSKALKSFDDHYRIYHYPHLPCDHVILTPTGIVILEVYNIAGSFAYHQGHWKEAMTVGRALRFIVEERVSNPIALMQQMEIELKGRLEKELDLGLSVPIKSIVVFTHPTVELNVKGAPIPICKIDKLKKQVPLQAQRLSPDIYERLGLFLEQVTLG
jgi:hypothetical protein